MKIGDKVSVRIAHMTANGGVVKVKKTELLVRVGSKEFWIPENDCVAS